LGRITSNNGHDGFKKFWRDFRNTWQSLDLIINELRDCDKRVVALVTFERRGRGGLEVRRQTGAVHTLRDGLVTRIENYEGWAEALEAAAPFWRRDGSFQPETDSGV
jgi:ketosteroid isomerase-like protein